MGPYKGDFTTSDTVYVMFDSFSSDDPSASITLTGLAVTDIEIYKNGGTTQRASDAGYTLLDTDGIDFDGITGIHGFSIDLSDNTDAGFYTSGGEFDVVVSSVTIDGATINFHACSFSIDRTPKVNTVQVSGTTQTANDNGADINTLLTRIVGTLAAGTHNAQSGDTYAALPTNFADMSIAATTGEVDADVVKISTSATAADNLEASTLGIETGAAATGTLSTTQMTTNLTEATDDHYIGRTVIWTSGVLANQASDITDYTGATKMLTFTAVTEAPSNGDTFVIV